MYAPHDVGMLVLTQESDFSESSSRDTVFLAAGNLLNGHHLPTRVASSLMNNAVALEERLPSGVSPPDGTGTRAGPVHETMM